MSDDVKPTYHQALLQTREGLKSARVLDAFWTRRKSWPAGDERMAFVGEACDLVGRSLFPGDWTGEEFAARQHVYPFPSFEETIAAFAEDLRGWHHRRGMRPKAPQSDVTARLASDQRNRQRYDDFAAKWALFATGNGAALIRLKAVINWVVTAARNGNLQTHIRLAETARVAGAYMPAPDGFWNVEDPIHDRFGTGDIPFELPREGPHSGGSETRQLFVFFDRDSLARSVRTAESSTDSTELGSTYLSAYMQLAIAVIRASGITAANQGKVDDLRDIAGGLAPKFGIDPERSKTIIRYIGTIIREPESQKGRRPR